MLAKLMFPFELIEQNSQLNIFLYIFLCMKHETVAIKASAYIVRHLIRVLFLFQEIPPKEILPSYLLK